MCEKKIYICENEKTVRNDRRLIESEAYILPMSTQSVSKSHFFGFMTIVAAFDQS